MPIFGKEISTLSFDRSMIKVPQNDQLLLSYNKKREPLGIQPRDSFLNSKNAKVVVWAFVFTQDRKILLHRRRDNAKDNRGMWDKSVGGHVERSDLESSKAIAREVAEELYTDECLGNKSDNISIVSEIIKSMKFLGEWGQNETSLFADNIFFKYYRVNYEFSKKLIKSYRILPNGQNVNIHFFADAFVFLAPKTFETNKLFNSDYILVELDELIKAMETGFFPNTDIECNPTPDLKYIVDSPIWGNLIDFSEHIIM